MFRIIFLLLVVATALSQNKVGGTLIFSSPTMFGGSYKTKISEISNQYPLNGVANLAYGSESYFGSSVSYFLLEAGASSDFYLIQTVKELYFKGGIFLSYLRTSISDLDGSGFDPSGSQFDINLQIGAGYDINQTISGELNFGLMGVKGARLTVYFSL